MKMSIPESAKISRQAKDCMQDCVTEFLAFVTSEAAELCSGEKRKTINGKDVLHAFMSLGMENYAAVLAIYLARYRQYVSKGGEVEDDNEDEDHNSSNGSSA
uniref:ARAD1C29832p n=1 Tax=Blastobotrys adeninivorans TaxID=409370 RepID=A0A060T7S3_BLAAD